MTSINAKKARLLDTDCIVYIDALLSYTWIGLGLQQNVMRRPDYITILEGKKMMRKNGR